MQTAHLSGCVLASPEPRGQLPGIATRLNNYLHDMLSTKARHDLRARATLRLHAHNTPPILRDGLNEKLEQGGCRIPHWLDLREKSFPPTSTRFSASVAYRLRARAVCTLDELASATEDFLDLFPAEACVKSDGRCVSRNRRGP